MDSNFYVVMRDEWYDEEWEVSVSAVAVAASLDMANNYVQNWRDPEDRMVAYDHAGQANGTMRTRYRDYEGSNLALWVAIVPAV